MLSLIDIQTIDNEIADLEEQAPSYATMEKLSWFYTIKDHLEQSSTTSDVAPVLTGSEFLSACSGADIRSLFSILDEHMEAIKVIHPREYMSLIQKIQLLKSI